jgi:hypothetical protein
MDEYYTPAQVAEKLPGVTENLLRDWRFHGKGPRWTKVGRRVFYAERDLIAFMKAGVRTQTGQTQSVA